MIISAGYRIGPFEVESACVEHPAVKEAAAVASPDARRGDMVKAFIVLADGPRAESTTRPGEIKRFVRERHSAYAYPREIEFVDDLPKTLTGKIRRIELREAERERKAGAADAGCTPASEDRDQRDVPEDGRRDEGGQREHAQRCRDRLLTRARVLGPLGGPVAPEIARSSSRSARSNSSARKLSPIRITRMPGPGTPGAGHARSRRAPGTRR